MLKAYSAAAVLAMASAFGACTAQGPGGVAYETRSEPKSSGTTSSGATPSATPSSGATSSGDGGVISGGAATGEKKEQRGNTPPGTSRDGQGPAGGAIVDPTGAVTRGK